MQAVSALGHWVQFMSLYWSIISLSLSVSIQTCVLCACQYVYLLHYVWDLQCMCVDVVICKKHMCENHPFCVWGLTSTFSTYVCESLSMYVGGRLTTWYVCVCVCVCVWSLWWCTVCVWASYWHNTWHQWPSDLASRKQNNNFIEKTFSGQTGHHCWCCIT